MTEANTLANALFAETTRITDRTALSPVIVHAPHGGRLIPDRFRGAFTITAEALGAELDAMTDHFTDEIAASIQGASLVINGLSRFVVDVERFPDETEEMNTVGMGVLYTHGSRRQPVRTLAPGDEVELLDFFHAYSAELTRLTAAALAVHGRALIIDVHSYPRHPLPYELHAAESRPELCIGFEEFHAPESLLAQVAGVFGRLEQAANEPFHGAYVPLDYYQRDPHVRSVMLELRRDIYMDEAGVEAYPERVSALAGTLQRIVDEG